MRAPIVNHDLPHQIVINLYAGSGIYVSCNCLARKNPNGSLTHKPIQVRVLWQADSILQVYKDWHKKQGIVLETASDPDFYPAEKSQANAKPDLELELWTSSRPSTGTLSTCPRAPVSVTCTTASASSSVPTIRASRVTAWSYCQANRPTIRSSLTHHRAAAGSAASL